MWRSKPFGSIGWPDADFWIICFIFLRSKTIFNSNHRSESYLLIPSPFYKPKHALWASIPQNFRSKHLCRNQIGRWSPKLTPVVYIDLAFHICFNDEKYIARRELRFFSLKRQYLLPVLDSLPKVCRDRNKLYKALLLVSLWDLSHWR